MPEFRFYLDIKTTIWERNFYLVDAENYDQAVSAMTHEFEEQERNETPPAGHAKYLNAELLHDTSEEVSLEENNGSYTKELGLLHEDSEAGIILTNDNENNTIIHET